MRVTCIPAMALLLLLGMSGRIAGEEPKTPSLGTACIDEAALFGGTGKAQNTPVPGASPKFRWASTGGACPPENQLCVYYASGDCVPCGLGKVQWCDTYKCGTVYYTCCTCSPDAC